MLHSADRGTKGVFRRLRHAVRAACFVAVALPPSSAVFGNEKMSPPRSVADLHCSLLSIDTHIDVPGDYVNMDTQLLRSGDAQFTVEKLERACLDAVFLSVPPGQGVRNREGYDNAWRSTEKMIAGIRRFVDLNPETLAIARSVADIRTIAAGKRHAILIGVENGYVVGKEIGKVRRLYGMGVRYLTLAHIGHNDLTDSALPITELGDGDNLHGGLSAFGVQVVHEMNRFGMIVDVSHLSRQSMLDAVRTSSTPVIASHSAVAAIVPTPRNLDDEQIRALSARGGVVQLVGYSAYIRTAAPARSEAVKVLNTELKMDTGLAWSKASDSAIADYGRRLTALDEIWPRASVADYVDHIDHIVRLVGIDHVGIGSDFYAGGGAASGGLDGWMDITQNVNITQELRRRQYSDTDIAKIWGGNLLRVMAAVEKGATAQQP